MKKIQLIGEENNEVGSYTYTPYGSIIRITGDIGYKNKYRYKSYYYDQESDLYYCKTRYYNAEWGRWISLDSVEYLDPESIEGQNLFVYCGNNPVMYADPDGTSPWWSWALGGLAVAGLIVGSVFTGGLLSAALVGAAIGGGISLGTQAFSGDLNWGQFALDIGVGALTGMLGASGISKLGATFVGAGVGGVSNIASQLISGTAISDINWWKVGISTVVGGVAGRLGGAGNRNTNVSNSAKKVSKALGSINKVLQRTNSRYYSSARYAQAALTNVSNRFARELAVQQAKMFETAMISYGVGAVANASFTIWW